MTYLQMVNDVLARLREASVSTVTANSYSTLIGKFVNDSKRQVEDAWNWESLYTTITITTSSGTSDYTLTGSGNRFKINSVNNTTSQYPLSNVSVRFIDDINQSATTSNQQPAYYAISGSSSGDAVVRLYPTPDGTYTIKFNCYVPQATLSNDATELTIPHEAVVYGAYARALIERGEDGGLSSGEAYSVYRGILADQIAIEAGRHVEYDCWNPV